MSFIGAGKLGLPDNAMVALRAGCDMVNVAREAMLAIGCMQAQKCHTDHCPTGVATQNRWLARGLDPDLKAVRLAGYIRNLRRDLLKVAEATGVAHPALMTPDDVEILTGHANSTPLREIVRYDATWGGPNKADQAELVELMRRTAQEAEEAPPSEDAERELAPIPFS